MRTVLNMCRAWAIPVLGLAKYLWVFSLGIQTVGLSTSAMAAAMPVVYQTGFERTQGYDTNLDLVGQNGWLGAGSGGNGVVPGFFPGRGQQAYVGFAPPNPGYDSLFVYRPLNRNLLQAQFSVNIAVADSSTSQY